MEAAMMVPTMVLVLWRYANYLRHRIQFSWNRSIWREFLLWLFSDALSHSARRICHGQLLTGQVRTENMTSSWPGDEKCHWYDVTGVTSLAGCQQCDTTDVTSPVWHHWCCVTSMVWHYWCHITGVVSLTVTQGQLSVQFHQTMSDVFQCS